MSEVDQLVNKIDELERRLVVLETTGKQRVFTGIRITNNATVTTIYTHSTASPTTYSFDIEIIAIRTDVAGDTANYRRLFKAKNIGGTVTVNDLDQVSTTDIASWDHEDNAAWNLTVVVSGTNILIRVTGVAGQTIKWSYRGTVLQVS